MCLLDHLDEALLAKLYQSLISERSGTQYVAMVTKLVRSHCGSNLVEYYCKESSISDTNWLRYHFSSYFDQNSVEFMMLFG